MQDLGDVLNNVALDPKSLTQARDLATLWAFATKRAEEYAKTVNDLKIRGENLRRVSEELSPLPTQREENTKAVKKRRKEFETQVESILKKQLEVERQIDRANISQEQKTKRKLDLKEAITSLSRRDLDTARKLTAELENQLSVDKQRTREALRRRDNIRQIRKERQRRIGEDLALGAGFPLLFGGGVGAVGGGVAGALAGQGKGGFGLQILFSALGTQIDTFVASMQDKAKELGKAFSDINGSFDVLKEKLIISSKAEEKRIQALADQGRTVDANVEALKDFQRQFGSDSVTNIKNLSSELDRADRAFAKLGVSLLNLLNGPLLRFAKAGADLAELIDFPNTVNAASQGLDPRFRDAFKKDFRNILRELEKEQLRQRGLPTEEQRLELSKTALQQALDKYGPYRIEVTVRTNRRTKT